MSSPRCLRVIRVLFVVLLAASLARTAGARVPARADLRATAPVPVQPFAGERVSESVARFEVLRATGANDVRIVVARFPFDPSGWKSLPRGQAWTIVPCDAQRVPLARLGLADRTDTPLWWAVVWTDARSGALRASAARAFTLVPRFANRVAPDGTVRPSAAGRLPARPMTAASSGAARRTIELAAGYSLVPGGPMPQLPSILSRAHRSPAVEAGGRAAYIVQFADDSPDSARARIASAGGAIVSPIAGDGFLVRMSADAKARLDQAGGQPWIANFEPAYKLSTALDATAAGRVDVTALLFADGDDDATAIALRALGAVNVKTHRGSSNHLARFELDRSRLADVAALADIEWVEPSPHDSLSNDQAQWVVQSGVANSRPVWDHGIRGQGQIVMTSDSGIRPNHEMFDDSTQAITGWGDYPTHRKIIAYKPGSDDPLVAFGDDVQHDYHGTHTGGTVAGNPDPYSTAPWSGMAKDAKLYFMDMAGSGDGGLCPPPDLNDLFQPSYTGNAGGAARISSNSWGSSVLIGKYTIQAMEVDQFVWNHPNYLIAFASGNYGVFNSVQSPGTAKNCLTVGASGNGSQLNKLAQFSSRGPVADGRRKPTVLAPGDLVTSSVGNTRFTYVTYSGTSMATPAAAGALALARQYLTEGSYPTGVPVAANAFEPSAALLKAISVAAARNDIVSHTAPNNSIGFGRLTIDDVLYFPGDTQRTLFIDPRDGLEDQRYVEYEVRVTNPTQPLKIALCWSDAPATPLAQVALVNDLDLVVTHDGTTYRGNYLLNNVSAPGGFRDSLNVEEFVRLATPGTGVWTVRVEAHRVVQGPQPFALCITGGVGGSNGAVALDRFQYSLTDTLGIEVVDANAFGPVTVRVASSTEPWGQPVTLTGGNGVFRGAIAIAPVAIQLADGVLAVSSGDLVSVIYDDGSPGVQVVATARVNVQAPTITNVHATALSATQAVVSWTTDVAATTRVHFGSSAALASTADSSGLTTQHAALLTGLQAGSAYSYDVESVTPRGDSSRDSLGGAHRSFTTRGRGSLAVLMDDPSPTALQTWTNALAALGWDADVLPAAANDPPLVGNMSAGLRSYDAVMWQVGPDNYPPFSDAQRAAIDSLLNGGGRLLVTGHDIGFGLSDAGSPAYSPEREAWLEHGLMSRYYFDNLYADTLTGVAGSPISDAYLGPIYYPHYNYPDAGDNVVAAPGNDGVWSSDWTENLYRSGSIGMHWESNTPRGTSGVGVWGGKKSRLVGMFFEWAAVAGNSSANLDVRTGVLERSVAWLLGHNPPEVHLISPTPGTVVHDNFLPITFSIRPDVGRVIASRVLDYSLDGGETWKALTTLACADSGCIWDLGGALGGAPTLNSTRAMLRVRVGDDGSPSLHGSSVMSGVFTLARPSGDTRGPVPVAGSGTCSPVPIRTGVAATLFATFSDAETGGGAVSAAEYSLGAAPAPAGSGTAMLGAFGSVSVEVSAPLVTDNVTTGSQTLWVRGRDAQANWGAATAITVPSVSQGNVDVADEPAVDFLAPPSPNPFRGGVSVRFGLARASNVRLELFDLAGRRVRTLATGVLSPGTHVSVWDGRDHRGIAVGSGVYFLRLVTPAKTYRVRLVALN